MEFKLSPKENELISLLTQGIFLTANFWLFVHHIWNSYLIISVMFVLSLFMLQIVNRRFLLVIPVNTFMNKYVKFCDTHILKIFLLLSASFLYLGIYLRIPEKSNWALCALKKFDDCIAVLLPLLGFGFLILLPIYWWKWGAYSVKKKIVNKLKNESYDFVGKCPICKGIAEIMNRILEDGKCHQKVKCFAKCASDTNESPRQFENVFEAKIGFVERPIIEKKVKSKKSKKGKSQKRK